MASFHVLSKGCDCRQIRFIVFHVIQSQPNGKFKYRFVSLVRSQGSVLCLKTLSRGHNEGKISIIVCTRKRRHRLMGDLQESHQIIRPLFGRFRNYSNFLSVIETLRLRRQESNNFSGIRWNAISFFPHSFATWLGFYWLNDCMFLPNNKKIRYYVQFVCLFSI